VLSTTVSGPTSVVARLRIAADAPLGFRDLKVTTGAQDAALLDGFEVRPVAAGGASGSGGGTAGAGSSRGGGAQGTCTDRARPTASLLKGRRGVSVAHRKLALHGRASDRGCTAAIAVAGRVARVEVAISRAAGRRCRFAAATGKLGKARSCSKPLWLRAKGTTSFSLSLKRALPRGSYTIQVRAVDAAGNRAKVVKRTQRVH
jgi:hypothetical protein